MLYMMSRVENKTKNRRFMRVFLCPNPEKLGATEYTEVIAIKKVLHLKTDNVYDLVWAQRF